MLSSKATTFKKTQWPEYLTTLAIFATFASNPAANLENRVLSRPISLKGQLQKNLQEQEINLELFLLRKTFTDSMKNDLFRLNKHESSISEKKSGRSESRFEISAKNWNKNSLHPDAVIFFNFRYRKVALCNAKKYLWLFFLKG